jgi:hypothetical protein
VTLNIPWFNFLMNTWGLPMTLVNFICNYLYPTAEMLQARARAPALRVEKVGGRPLSTFDARIFGIDRAIASFAPNGRNRRIPLKKSGLE